MESKLDSFTPEQESADSEQQDTQEFTTDSLTKYENADAYKPKASDDFFSLVGGENVLLEFKLTDATEHIGEQISLRACVHKIRNMGKVSFIYLRTGEYVIQAVYSDKCRDSIKGLREGHFVCVEGTVNENPKDPIGVEIVLSDLKLINEPKEEYPLKISQKKLDCSIEVNLDNRSVSLRNPYERAIFKLQEGLVHGMHEFMRANGFTEIHTPKIVAQGAEGGANIFKIDYFQKPAFLNQSPQFYKQTAVAFFDRVYEIAPVYRAEKHATSRHINEYIGLDFEMGYIDSMYDVMNMEIAMLRHIMSYLKENYKYELELLNADVPDIGEVPTIKFKDALTLLRGKSVNTKFDLDPEDEVKLGEYAKEKYNSDFIFITHFPSSKPPFYAMDSREDPRDAYKFDLLFRGLEITSGGQRIHDYDEQIAKLKRQGLDPADFASYLEAHKYGLPPHGGLGIGLERLLMKLLKLSNIRSTSMFPRDINRLLP
ncbi:MAG: aspartate--tRNA(Asn) ligase [Ruminococcus sp.]|nr:aspartate--tRNA(Asn) ligase [Ruminococcus sp.]